MSAAADRPVRLRLGTRIAALGSIVVLAVWSAAAHGWMRERQDELDARPSRLAASREQLLLQALHDRLAAPPSSLDQAVRAAEARRSELAALRETRRGRRLVDDPEAAALVREQLEPVLLDLGAVDAAWLRRGAHFDWAPRGRPRLGGGSELLDGPCLLDVPGGRLALGRCAELALGEAVAGAARVVDLSDLEEAPGELAWALALDGPEGAVLAGGGWATAGGLPETSGLPASAAVASLPGWRLRESPGPEPRLRLLIATAPAHRLSARELLRGEAGPSTADWRRFALRTGGVGLAALLFFALIGSRLNAAFAPVLAAARSLGADELDVRVPVRRSDEIGAIAAVLNDLGASLGHARRNWEREARLAAWRDVARGLAHEIKNPLTPIRGTVENLLRWRREEPARFEEKLEDRMGTILEEVDQLGRLATAFSDFARLPAPRKEACDLNALLRAVADLQLGDREGLRVDDRLDPGLGLASLDAGQVRQVATNLMKNAREALRESGGRVRLQSGRPRGGGVFFAVDDDGPGVDEASLDQLFVPGWSTRKAEGGSGLGLWLCHRIVLEHGGTIEGSRSDMGGLKVRVVLPDS